MNLKLIGVFMNNCTFSNKPIEQVLSHLTPSELDNLLTKNVPAQWWQTGGVEERCREEERRRNITNCSCFYEDNNESTDYIK